MSLSGLKEVMKLSDDEESRNDDQDAEGDIDNEDDDDEKNTDGVVADDEAENEPPARVEPKRHSGAKGGTSSRARRTLPTRRVKLPPGVERGPDGRIIDLLGLLEAPL